MLPGSVDAGGIGTRDERASEREQVAHFIAEAFSSPHPPPEILRAYNEVLPGLAKRMVDMTEEVSRHKMALERTRVEAQVENMRRDYAEGRWGQIFAALVALVTTCGATYASVHGAQTFGSFLGVGGLAAIVTTFVLGRKYGRKVPGQPISKPEGRKTEDVTPH